jgi:hypothetical protein
LAELEYLLIHRGPRGNSFAYELLYDGQGQDGRPFLQGLIDVKQLKHDYDANRSGSKPKRSGAGRPAVGDQSGSGQTDQSAATSTNKAPSDDECDDALKCSYTPSKTPASYPSHNPALLNKGA